MAGTLIHPHTLLLPRTHSLTNTPSLPLANIFFETVFSMSILLLYYFSLSPLRLRKSDSYPMTKLGAIQKRSHCKKDTKDIKSDNICYHKVGRAIIL